MKVISLWQPWASLMAIGAKNYETRSWTTSHRGEIAIHAAKRWTEEEIQTAMSCMFRHAFLEADVNPIKLPLGGIVAIGELVAVYRADLLYPKIQAQERAFGNYGAGRFAWRIDNIRQVEFVPLRGDKGLFDFNGQVKV
jgi:hypothetical protein